MAIEIIPDTSSGASGLKKEIFNIFNYNRETEYFATRDWIVLPSVQIPLPQDPKSLLIDFVILISPDFYNRVNPSVICLQVVEDQFYFSPSVNHWCQTKKPGVRKDPRAGAQTAMESLKEHLGNHFDPNAPLSLGYAAVFTDSEYPRNPPLVTGDIYRSRSSVNADSLFKVLEDYAGRLEKDPAEWSTYEDLIDIEDIRDRLQFDLGRINSTAKPIFRHNLDTLHPQIIRLTEEQMISLDQVSEGKSHCIIDGAAGTGKTILAIELARRYCKDGNTVAFLCSNPNLSKRVERWAERISKEEKGAIVVGTPAKLPYQSGQVSPRIEQENLQEKLENSLKLGYVSNNWTQFIDNTVEDLNLNEGIFDYLIVDEAQNLFHEEFLKLMDVLLKGGLADGNWTMFGDFVNQDLVTLNRDTNGTEARGPRLIGEYDREWSRDKNYVKLKKNCRNTHQVAGAVAKLVDLEKSPHRSGVYGPRVQIRYFDTQEGLNTSLNDLITDWKNTGFQSKQFVLLSSRDCKEFNTESGYAGWGLCNINDVELTSPEGSENVLVPQSPHGDDTLIYSDIYDFQGLESDVVILVLPEAEDDVKLAGDIWISNEEHLNKVLYIGMSRAKTMLVIFAHQDYEKALTAAAEIDDTDDNIQVIWHRSA